MAGTFTANPSKPADVLFDLTPDDTRFLPDSDLLQLVNHGQLQKPVEVAGANGKKYTIDMALLWDDDHIDILKRTSAYAADPILRVRILRRLKLHRAIQRINAIDYSNKEDPQAQRQLWTILSRLSDIQMEQLDGEYIRLEMERGSAFVDALKALSTKLDDTAPKEVRPQESKKTDSGEHALLMKQTANNKQATQEAVANTILETIEGKSGGATATAGEAGRPVVASPKQGHA